MLLPALFFVGLVTFERAIQMSIEDVAYNRRISRIRRFYLEVAPSLAGYLARAVDDSRAGVMREAGITNSRWQSFVATAGLLAGYICGSLATSVVAGVIVAAIAIGLHLTRQRALWHRADGESKREFSAPIDPIASVGSRQDLPVGSFACSSLRSDLIREPDDPKAISFD